MQATNWFAVVVAEMVFAALVLPFTELKEKWNYTDVWLVLQK